MIHRKIIQKGVCEALCLYSFNLVVTFMLENVSFFIIEGADTKGLCVCVCV